VDGEPEAIDAQTLAETPEDVAVLYSWANLQGAKYRDFSASRREYRAQMRHRAAEMQIASEERAREEAERSAAAAEQAAREAEEAARYHALAQRQSSGTDALAEDAAQARAMRHAAELNRRAAAERMEASRRAEAVAAAEAASRREAREMAEARASADRQAARYEQGETRRSRLAGPQPDSRVPGATSDPYTDPTPQPLPGRIFHQPSVSEDDMLPQRHPQTRDVRLIVPQADPALPNEPIQPREYRATGTIAEDAAIAAAGTYVIAHEAEKPGSPIHYYDEPQHNETYPGMFGVTTPAPAPVAPVAPAAPVAQERPRGFQPDEASGFHPIYKGPKMPGTEPYAPAWLSGQDPQRGTDPLRRPGSPVNDTLEHSRERQASKWYALKGVFDPTHEVAPEPARKQEMPVPMVTVFSMAGGTGKTSLVATLGRALSASGERVLLTDTTSHGLLPYYFGASELRPGVVRTFSPPAGSADAPIYLVSYDVPPQPSDPAAQQWLMDELARNSRGLQRVVLDLAPSAAWLAKRLAQMNSVVIVPVAPDMNSVISLGTVEKFFNGVTDGQGKPVQPYFLLNQFDSSQRLHLDVREVMRRQLGDRLLPFVIRRSQSVSEALAEGMTVMDYAADAAVATDYMNLASWLRSLSMPAAAVFTNARWSER
jgi:cellulose synthase operon protein YhjQ